MMAGETEGELVWSAPGDTDVRCDQWWVSSWGLFTVRGVHAGDVVRWAALHGARWAVVDVDEQGAVLLKAVDVREPLTMRTWMVAGLRPARGTHWFCFEDAVHRDFVAACVRRLTAAFPGADLAIVVALAPLMVARVRVGADDA